LSWLGLVRLGDPGVLDPGGEGEVGAPGGARRHQASLPCATAGDARKKLVSAIAMPTFYVMMISSRGLDTRVCR
jgi:hypothetical protein